MVLGSSSSVHPRKGGYREARRADVLNVQSNLTQSRVISVRSLLENV